MGRNFRTGLVISGILLMSVMLFAPNPLESYERLNQSLWNMGHLFLFAFLCGLILMQAPLQKRRWQVKLVFSLLFSLLLGGAIEVAQYSVGRYMEFHDLLLDVLGGLLAFLIVVFYLSPARGVCSRQSREGGRTGYKILGSMLILLVLLLAFYPVFMIVLDDYRMQRDFPVLAALESEYELPRWEADNVRSLTLDSTAESVKKGQFSLRVVFSVSEYSAITLQSFAADWRGYKQLNISLYNDQADALPVELKVFDQRHTEAGYKYMDRFNRELILTPGWNDIRIDLLDVQNAPQSRKIDLQKMTVISLFVYQQSESKIIHIDDVHLSL